MTDYKNAINYLETLRRRVIRRWHRKIRVTSRFFVRLGWADSARLLDKTPRSWKDRVSRMIRRSYTEQISINFTK